MTLKLLYLDTETSGLDPKQNALLQISGIIEIIEPNKTTITKEFDFKLRPHPSAIIEDKALKCNHTTREQLLDPDRLEPIDVYKKLKSIFLTHINRYDKQDKLYLVGQNVHFDYGFLLELWKRHQDDYLGSFIHHNKIDLIALTASFKIAGVLPSDERLPNMKLESLCRYFGLDDQKHDSLSDIKQTRQIFIRMVDYLKHLQSLGGKLS